MAAHSKLQATLQVDKNLFKKNRLPRLLVAVSASLGLHSAVLTCDCVAISGGHSPLPSTRPVLDVRLASAAHAAGQLVQAPPPSEKIDWTPPANTATDPEGDIDSTSGTGGIASGFLPLATAEYMSAKELKRRPQIISDLDLYPPSVNQITERGKLIAHIFIGEDGTVDTVAIQPTKLPPAFVEHVRTAFMKSRFTAGERDGQTVKSRIRIEVSITSTE